MYKIMIVDDEAEIREGIEELIQWEDHGFQFIGGYENGREALEASGANVPDVILTDICMPFLDGLELAERIKHISPFTRLILLTGYDDFEYAQRAIQLNVYDYLLKPFSAGQLRNLLDKVKLEMDEDYKQKEDIQRLKMQLNQSLPLLKEKFLEKLVTTSISRTELEEKLDFFDIRLVGPCYMAIVVDIDDFGSRNRSISVMEQELLRFAVYNIVEEIMVKPERGIAFRSRDEQIVVILSCEADDSAYYFVQQLAEETRQCMERYLKFTVTVGIGTTCSTLLEIASSCQKAMAAIDYRFLLGKNKVISIADFGGMVPTETDGYPEWEKKLLRCLRTSSSHEIESIIEEWMLYFKRSLTPMPKCHLYLQKFHVALLDMMDELGGERAEFSLFQSTDLFSGWNAMKTLDDIGAWLKTTCRQVMDELSNIRIDQTRLKVLAAEQYIKSHYSDEALSLQEVCRHVQISPSYLGVVFKTHTGQTFIEYLTRTRVDKAKELLKLSGLKAFEIAERTGYRDPHYFSLLFKKNTGMSPTDYREMMMADPYRVIGGGGA
ncbi:response regulator [Paenibacillus sp. GP183]|uniref:response regulator n=1 Tax=Paenibacillus sp. GP183 TaxID=1882751 RepID=UPI00089B550D|nr:response regulator [Paenibacillus sp. GP183]SEC02318.1 two-component system, response regulator YesN [Paenibacillus sp. GP183]